MAYVTKRYATCAVCLKPCRSLIGSSQSRDTSRILICQDSHTALAAPTPRPQGRCRSEQSLERFSIRHTCSAFAIKHFDLRPNIKSELYLAELEFY